VTYPDARLAQVTGGDGFRMTQIVSVLQKGKHVMK
jgi:hypothetical protein